MNIFPISDVHLEFFPSMMSIDDIVDVVVDLQFIDEQIDIVVLAGDIGTKSTEQRTVEFINHIAKHCDIVAYLPGNHELWKRSLVDGISRIQQIIAEQCASNVVFLDITSPPVIFHDTVLIGDCLFSDFAHLNPLVMYDCRQQLNDFRKIRTGPIAAKYQRKITPQDIANEFFKRRDKIFSLIEQHKDKKIIVGSHYPPRSLVDHFGPPSSFDGAIADVDQLIVDVSDVLHHDDNLWISGHVHRSNSTELGKFQLVSNPFGYFQIQPNDQFDKHLKVTI